MPCDLERPAGDEHELSPLDSWYSWPTCWAICWSREVPSSEGCHCDHAGAREGGVLGPPAAMITTVASAAMPSVTSAPNRNWKRGACGA